MRAVVRLLVVGLVLLLGVLPCSDAAARKQGPVALHLRWRLVTAEPNYVAASDRYVAIVEELSAPSEVMTLLDQQAHEQQRLTAPGCSQPLSPMFGGPWLFVTCSYGSYELYNLITHRWVAVTLSSQCHGSCMPVAVGRYWIKLATDEGLACGDHCGINYVLQNIATGEFKADPVTPGGQTFDDLSAPSGSVPLCAPLRYPRFYDGAAQRWEPGRLTFDGQFAIAWSEIAVGWPSTLERCHSHLRLSEYESASADSVALLSSRAMVWTYRILHPPKVSFRLAGLFLPSLQRFTASLPAPLHGRNIGTVVALSKRMLYATRAYGSTWQLWDAPLPGPPTPHKRR
jgi:hypothetical protein